jgi:polyhydroxyalkanoate synthesis regulator phasin
MSDEELCKRLLDFDKVTVGDARDAALRIKALTAENERLERVVKDISDEADLAEQEACMVEDDIIKAEKEIEALTTKLAKAMSIAKRVTSFEDDTQELAECGCARCKAHLDLRALLAEIEGEKP